MGVRSSFYWDDVIKGGEIIPMTWFGRGHTASQTEDDKWKITILSSELFTRIY